MPARNYKIADWGPRVGNGVSGSRLINVNGIAKTFSDAEPNIVANELIAVRLAQAILLPVPPGFIVLDGDRPWFVSLNFNLAGEPLPPVRPAKVVESSSGLAAGITLFDIWVMNGDRHEQNLAFDQNSQRLEVFDHSRALMPLNWDQRRLATEHGSDLVIAPPIGTHCLAPVLVDAGAFAPWLARIRAVPEFFIRDVLEAAVEVGLRPDNVDFFLEFLLKRREMLPTLVEDNLDQFPQLDLGLGSGLVWS